MSPLKTTTAALAALSLLPAAAAAQSPPPAPPPPPPPPAAKLSLAVEGAARSGRDRLVVSGQRWTVRGTVAPFAPGQEAVVQLFKGKRRIAVKRVPVVAAGPDGTFRMSYTATRSGRLRAVATVGDARASAPRVRVLASRAPAGARGRVVRALQAGLDRLGYAVPRSGVVDGGTSRAIMAFRKVNGMRRTGAASGRVIRAVLAGRGAFKPRHPRAGRHLEADLSRQVLALVDGDRVVATYTTSSGAPSTPTVVGAFRVYRKTPGVNAKEMVHSAYFIRGFAVHGFKSVPPFPASHGCLRVPIPDARAIFDWLRMGTKVFVYR